MAKDNAQAVTRDVPIRATYLDTKFRSRVIVFPDGNTLHVVSGEVVATTAAHIAYLDANPDYKRLEERG
ncbi:hypothetical protein WI73_28465 [Burkholderia ubonensis]|uniref:hypothetical protein n=1 Tax=Burkholderia ubonensis TaxID=101571 RepID=UPI0007582142|nr:hypothetical protein [Burkholderia ubonensis]KVC61640.1 hypothetical protein WI73_28465 [Burkholderia ubonensis]